MKRDKQLMHEVLTYLVEADTIWVPLLDIQETLFKRRGHASDAVLHSLFLLGDRGQLCAKDGTAHWRVTDAGHAAYELAESDEALYDSETWAKLAG